MKKIVILMIVAVVAIAMAVPAFAVMPGKNVEYAGGGAGKVVFDGKAHKDAGNKCNDCHPALFKMKKGGAKLTMKDMNAGKNCGSCHNGTKAFSSKANCNKCHKK